MIASRKETCQVSYDTCGFCHVEQRVEVTVGNERFDPRSRSHGFHLLRLWPGHPHDHKSICSACRSKGAHQDPAIPTAIEGMVRAKVFDVEPCANCNGAGCGLVEHFCQGGWVYNEQGLRLSPRPPDPAKWDVGLVVVGDLAVPLHRREGCWVPTFGELGRLVDEWLIDLNHGERKVLLIEPTPATPYPYVREPLLTEDAQWAGHDEAHQTLWPPSLQERSAHGALRVLRLRELEIMQ